MRLQVWLARAGIASRRASEALILAGRVSVNGDVVRTLGTKIDPERDRIRVDGRLIEDREELATIVLHKPHGVVSTMSDPEGRETVVDLVKAEPLRLVPVGRLDYASEGVLLLSNDGDLTHRLLHPGHHAPKVYFVEIRGRPPRAAVDRLRTGVDLEDGRTRPAVVEVLEEGARSTWLEVTVAEGRNRLLRRMCERVGHEALRVVRMQFASVELGALKPGQYRYLGAKELEALYRSVDLEAPPPASRAGSKRGASFGKARRGRGALPR